MHGRRPVVRGPAAQLLALRDELTSREFDDPGPWWSETRMWSVDGTGRRAARGARPGRNGDDGAGGQPPGEAARRAGAPSRGVLPLLGVAHGAEWVDRVELKGMATFALMLVTPDGVSIWQFDGARLE